MGKEEVKKLCPLMSGDLLSECLKNKCGFWNDYYNSCSITAIVSALIDLRGW